MAKNSKVTGRYFIDTDLDGVDNDRSNGLGGVDVALYHKTNNGWQEYSRTTTRDDGHYNFEYLPAGKFYVRFLSGSENQGAQFADYRESVDDTKPGATSAEKEAELVDSDVARIFKNGDGRSEVFELNGNNKATHIDAGAQFDGSIGGHYFQDINNNGTWDTITPNNGRTADELGVAGEKVYLYDTEDNNALVAVTETNANGYYVFTGLPAGKYMVGFKGSDLAQDFVEAGVGNNDRRDSDVTSVGGGATGYTQPVDLGVNETVRGIDGGIALKGSGVVRGHTFIDKNGNELQDDSDAPVEGITVILRRMIEGVDEDGNPANVAVDVTSTTTNANGGYRFDNVPDGNYCVLFMGPDGARYVDLNVGNDDTIDSDVNHGAPNGETGMFTIENGSNELHVDAGFVDNAAFADPETACIGGRYFIDENRDGLEGVLDEPGVAGVEIRLRDLATQEVIATTTTDENGNYLFENLPAGRYCVIFPADEHGRVWTESEVGKLEVIDSDVKENNEGLNKNAETGAIVLEQEEKAENVDAGVYDPETACIGGRYFVDENDNDRDDGEPGVAGVTVTLRSVPGLDTVATTVTDENGNYTFENLPAGRYCVYFDKDPEGRVWVEDNIGADDNDSDVKDMAVGRNVAAETGAFDIKAGEIKKDVDGGTEDPGTASLEGKVFCDTDYNNRDNGDGREPGEEGVIVELLNADGNIVATTTTDAGGEYRFDNLDAGDYSVRFPTDVNGKTLVTANDDAGGNRDDRDSDADQETGVTGTVSLEIGENKKDIDAGVEDPRTASLEGKVFCDTDFNNRDNGDGREPGEEGVVVELLNANGNVVATTTTDAGGEYRFDNLEAGDYSVRFPTDVNGKTLVTANDDAGGNRDDRDSDADQETGVTGTVSLEIGENKKDIDAGVEDPRTASLGDTVWFDENGNGTLDGGEARAEGVEVQLMNEAGKILARTTTDADGNYLFDNLEAGDYKVTFITPDGFTFTTEGTAADDAVNNDSDADVVTGMTGVTSLEVGEAERDLDAGLVRIDNENAEISGRVFCDENDNSLQDGTEPGIENTRVELLDASGTVIATMTSGTNGAYSFTGLAAGTYSVRFPEIVAGKTAVDANIGDDDTIDSDAGENGQTDPITLEPGEKSENNDAGFEDPMTASLGDTVWFDENGNGVLDSGEARAEGVVVRLFHAIGGEMIAQETTDANGNYLFENLKAGEYTLQFFAPDGFMFTQQSTVAPGAVNNDSDVSMTGASGVVDLDIGEDERDVDAGLLSTREASLSGRLFCDDNKDGVDNGEPGFAGVEVVLMGQSGFGNMQVMATTTTDAEGNYEFTDLPGGVYMVKVPTLINDKTLIDPNIGDDDTIDSDADMDGTIGPISLGMNAHSANNDAGFMDPMTASLGDTVWFDENGNGVLDGGEGRAEGVTVKLIDPATGDVIATQQTDVNGNYLFENLKGGDYQVMFVSPNGFEFTTESNVPAGTVNNDSDADQVTGMTGIVDLEIGEQERDVDAGLVEINEAPVANDDAGKTCANEELTLNVLANDMDADRDILTITQVDGQAISEGGSITTSAGTIVSLVAGELVFDGEAAYEALDIGEMATETVSYTISDGNGGVAMAEVEATFCGSAETIAEICESLPDRIEYQVRDSILPGGTVQGSFAYDMNIISDDPRLDGIFGEAYCLTFDDDIAVGFEADYSDAPVLAADIYCSTDVLPDDLFNPGQVGSNGETAAENMDQINYILNQNYEENGFSGWEVQYAVWSLTDNRAFDFVDNVPGFEASAANIEAILADAAANGEDFMPGMGDRMGIIVDPNPETPENEQPFIIAVDTDALDCLC